MKFKIKNVDSVVEIWQKILMRLATMETELMETGVQVLVRSKQVMNAYNFLQLVICFAQMES